jgi:hypothetical protein
MIRYEYETLQGQLITGLADHVTVRYTNDGIRVLAKDTHGLAVDVVDVISYLAPPSTVDETHKFVCDRFTIDGRDII